MIPGGYVRYKVTVTRTEVHFVDADAEMVLAHGEVW